MKLLMLITSTFLQLGVLATPLVPIPDASIAITRDREARSAGLADSAQYCDIVNVVTTVDCVRTLLPIPN